MRKSLLLSATLALTVLGAVPFSAFAQQIAPGYSQGGYQVTTIPQFAAIVVRFLDGMQFEVDDDETQPVTLMLAQPILDSNGNVVAPANSVVQARIVPVDDEDGVQIHAEAIVAGSQAIPVQAISSTIPTERIRRPDADANNQRRIAEGSRLHSALAGARTQSNNPDDIDTAVMQGGYEGAAWAMFGNAVQGIFRSNRMTIASIAPDSVWVLTLQAPVSIPAIAATADMSQGYQAYSEPSALPVPATGSQIAPQQYQLSANVPVAANVAQPTSSQQYTTVQTVTTQPLPAQSQVAVNQPPIQQSSSAEQTEFSFRTVAQYTEVLEQLIADYRQGKISIDQVRNTIEAADRFATTRLTQQLYPLGGVRQQVTQLLGFTYAIDR